MATRRLLAAAALAACVGAIAVPVVAAQDDRPDRARLVNVETPPTGQPTEPAKPPRSHTPRPPNEERPGIRETAARAIRVGQSWQVELDGDGPDTVSLVGPAGKGSVEAGEVELVVELTHSGIHRIGLPAGWSPEVVMQTVRTSGPPAILVRQEGEDSSTLWLYGWWDGRLGELAAPNIGIPLGNGFQVGDVFTTYWTIVTPRGRLITFRTPAEDAYQPHAADAWEWLASDGSLGLKALGALCQNADDVTWSRCP